MPKTSQLRRSNSTGSIQRAPESKPKSSTSAPKGPTTTEAPRGRPKTASQSQIADRASGNDGFLKRSNSSPALTGQRAPAQQGPAQPVDTSAFPNHANPNGVWHDPQKVIKQGQVAISGQLNSAEQFKVPASGTHTINGKPMQFFDHPVGQSVVPLKQEPQLPVGHMLSQAKPDSVGAHTPTQHGVYLPWGDNQAHRVDLSKIPPNVKFFTTAPLDGCALLVGGPKHAPVLMHANQDVGGILEHGPKIDARTQAYSALEQHVKGKPGGIPSENFQMFQPKDYQHPSTLGKTSVIGTRGEDGNWTLHHSATHLMPQTQSWGQWMSGKPANAKPTPVGGQLWPQPDLAPLRQGKDPNPL